MLVPIWPRIPVNANCLDIVAPHTRWLAVDEIGVDMKLVSVVTAMLVSASVQASAQQPTFPLRQDGGARNEFVKIAADTCLKKQLAAPQNKGRSPITSLSTATVMREP